MILCQLSFFWHFDSITLCSFFVQARFIVAATVGQRDSIWFFEPYIVALHSLFANVYVFTNIINLWKWFLFCNPVRIIADALRRQRNKYWLRKPYFSAESCLSTKRYVLTNIFNTWRCFLSCITIRLVLLPSFVGMTKIDHESLISFRSHFVFKLLVSRWYLFLITVLLNLCSCLVYCGFARSAPSTTIT